MVLLEPLPDELFVSLLARIGRSNGFLDLRDIAKRLFGSDMVVSFIDARLNLPEFCERVNYLLGTPESILQKFTLLGARRYLGEFEPRVWNAIIKGQSRISMADLTFSKMTELYFCPVCSHVDVDKHGYTYWHRIHQVQILNRCALHNSRLKKPSIKRSTLHQSFPLPGDFDEYQCEEKNLPDLDEKFEIELIALIQGLLEQPPEYRYALDIVLEGLHDIKLTTVNGVLKPIELIYYLEKSFLNSISVNMPKDGLLKYMKQIVSGMKAGNRGVSFGRAFFLCSLFSNRNAVEQKHNWLEVFGSSIQSGRVKEADPLSWHRAVCLEYIAKNPLYSRLGFTQKNYRSFSWLLKYDAEWMDINLPIYRGPRKQYSFFNS